MARVLDEANTSTMQSFVSARSYHRVSRKYLPLYVAELQFHHNNRENAGIFGRLLAALISFWRIPLPKGRSIVSNPRRPRFIRIVVQRQIGAARYIDPC